MTGWQKILTVFFLSDNVFCSFSILKTKFTGLTSFISCIRRPKVYRRIKFSPTAYE